MKKLIYIFAFLGLFTFLTPKTASAEQPCITVTLECDNGWEGYVVICDTDDLAGWAEIYCGLSIQ